jgi:hypothetical protein
VLRVLGLRMNSLGSFVGEAGRLVQVAFVVEEEIAQVSHWRETSDRSQSAWIEARRQLASVETPNCCSNVVKLQDC